MSDEDLVARLRAYSDPGDPTIENEAADRIEQLQAQLDEALASGISPAVVPTPPVPGTCSDCMHYDPTPTGDEAGRCRAHPPQPFYDFQRGKMRGFWAPTGPDDSCGEYSGP